MNAYDRAAEAGWQTRGNARDYRLVGPDQWPKSVHYEFGNYLDKAEVGVELHLESEKVRGLTPCLAVFGGRELVDSITLKWDPKWSNKRGRLVAKVRKDQGPDVAVRAMLSLISLTRPIIEKNLMR